MESLKTKLYIIPGVRNFVDRYIRKKPSKFNGSISYWEERYKYGGVSGGRSYGKVALYKATFINNFVYKNKIKKIVDFGCGDGNQLEMSVYPEYIGLDVSESTVTNCKRKFLNDNNKKFLLYNPENFDALEISADLTLSLEVIFHLVEDNIFELYMKHLFQCSKNFVIIFSSDFEDRTLIHPHIKNRNFSAWIKKNIQGWTLKEIIRTADNLEKDLEKSVQSDFFIYEKD